MNCPLGGARHLAVLTISLCSPSYCAPQVGVLCIVLSGVLTIFFRGLLELSKSFLDPFGNAERNHDDDFRQSISTDALISEASACACTMRVRVHHARARARAPCAWATHPSELRAR